MKLPVKSLLLILGGAATVYALVLLLTGEAPLDQLLQALCTPTGLAAAGLCVLNYLLRGQRWRLWMAHYGRPLPAGQGLRLYLAGYTFTPTPANVGEALRGMLLREPLSAADSMALYGAERLADLLALLLLTVPVLFWLLQQPQIAVPGLWLALVVAGLVLLALLWRLRHHLLRRMPWLATAGRCLAHRPAGWLALTLVAWAAQGTAAWLICRAFGLDVDLLLAAGFYALAMVGGALSLLPAGLGGTEALLAGLLVLHGAPLATAVAATVLIRLLTLWLAVGLGAMSLIYSAAFRRDLLLR